MDDMAVAYEGCLTACSATLVATVPKFATPDGHPAITPRDFSHKMERYILALVLMALSFGSLSSRHKGKAMENPAPPITPGMSYNFTDEELFEFRKKSEAGDAESSRKLFLFYNFAVRNRLKAAEWLKKAAEQGSPDAQYGLAYEFSYQGSPRYDLEKAKYWALKAAHNGQTQAPPLLQKLRNVKSIAILSNRARYEPAYDTNIDCGAHAKQSTSRPKTAATTLQQSGFSRHELFF